MLPIRSLIAFFVIAFADPASADSRGDSDNAIFVATNGASFTLTDGGRTPTVRGHRAKDGAYRCGKLK